MRTGSADTADSAVQGGRGRPLLNMRVVSILAASYTSVMGVQMISPLLPKMQSDLRLSAVEAGWIMSSFSISALVMTLPAGIVADRVGGRRVLGFSLLVFGLSGTAVSVFHSMAAIMALRVIQGFGYAAILPLTIAALTLAVPGDKVAMAQGYRAVTMSAAEFTLPLLAGAVLALSSAWQLSFIALMVPAFLGVTMLRQASSRPSATPTPARPVRYGHGLLTAAADTQILSVISIGFIRFWVKFAFFTFVPLYLAARLHATPASIGGIVAEQGLVGALVSTQSGRLGLRRAGRVTLVVSIVVVGCAIAAVPAVSTIWWAAVMAGVIGVADGTISPLVNGFISVLPPAEVRTGVIAVSGAARNLAKAVSPLAIGFVVADFGYQAGFLAAGALGVAAAGVLFPLFAGSAERGAGRAPAPDDVG